MDKKLRLKIVKELDTKITQAAPEFVQTKIKSMYVWPAETVWQKSTEICCYFLILTPELKRGEDKVTLELAWSRLKRFPELMQRPWLVTKEDLLTAHELQEGSVRIHALCDREFDWLPVSTDSVAEAIDFVMTKLMEKGFPFLDSLQRG